MPDEHDQQEVIAFLSDPASHRGGGPVERIDTHAAIIFLAGERAYKLKRAVRYPYLDYTSPAKRRAVCETELALNRRTAPGLYLAVRAIGRLADGRLAFGRGTALDWVIVMRRFAQNELFDTKARAGELTPKLLRELADAIARFHADAEIVARRSGAAIVRRVIEGNRDSMAAAGGDVLAPTDCARVTAAQLEALAAATPLLDRRAAAGHVRHGHGDLHLANICLWRGRPTLFDCLEFDPGLATSDLLYDLAFLLMDLWQRGLEAEASIVFNRYCDRRAETEGIALLPLFLSMRAAVRAHVEAASAARQMEPSSREAHRQAARNFLDAALRLVRREPPSLIAIGGLSGTGKSTLAAALAPLIGAAPGARVLRTDVLRKRLAGIEPEARLPRASYTAEAHAAAYAELFSEAARTLAAGWPVVIDAVFDYPETRAAAGRLAADLAIPFHGLWLAAPPDKLRERVRARRNDASDAGPSVVDLQLGRDIGDLGGWIRIDAGGDARRTLRRVRNILEL